MHLEILVEDSSGMVLLDTLLPRLLGQQGETLTWRLHAYKGIGRIPKGLSPNGNSSKRMLLDQLPKLLGGYGRTPGVDAVVVVIDTDKNDCVTFLAELKKIAESSAPSLNILFRLAVEEMEAWYFGDNKALLEAYPKAKREVLGKYVQDSVCGTWELLADAVRPGGSSAIKKEGWPLPGQVKHEWADKIGPLMEPDLNNSPSFCKFRDGLRQLAHKK
jgi:hypothetical protein